MDKKPLEFNKGAHIHFIGIGGISMSGLAKVLLSRGYRVSGSDSAQSDLTRQLEAAGAEVFFGQRAENLASRPDYVVYTSAIHPDNPEYAEAERQGLPLINRADLLGALMSGFAESYAVAGTHGKTTTTALVSEILLAADKDPTISIGGIYDRISGNIRIGASPVFVTEACEYTDSFLSLHPKTGLILNVQLDHIDYFADLNAVIRSFATFASQIAPDGLLVIREGVNGFDQIVNASPAKYVTFGLNDTADYWAKDVTYLDAAGSSFHLMKGTEDLGEFRLKVPGEHNVLNALAALAAVWEKGLDLRTLQEALAGFVGTRRRFEYKGQVDEVTIIDDYAHHPDEIRATLTAAKRFSYPRIWCVFQPHTYSRTKAFLTDFADALALADRVVLAPIYPARETDNLGISSEDLGRELEKRGKEVTVCPSFTEIENLLLTNCCPGDLLITMGAGDIVKVGESLLGA